MNDLISRQAAINALKGLPTWWADSGGYYGGAQPPMEALLDPEDAVSAIENLPSAEQDMAENLYQYKCCITDEDGLQHEVIHTDDIRRVTGWEI